jgi:hypothetical protein
VRLRPDFAPTAEMSRTDKSLLLAGTCDDGPVVAKLLTAPDPYWTANFTKEITAYRTFAADAPPVRTPRLVAADEHTSVLIIERIEGHPMATDRYPGALAPSSDLNAVVETMTTLARWQPPVGAFAEVYDYPARLARFHHEHALLDDTDYAALTALLEHAGTATCFAHGDPLPANLLRTAQGYALIDWEFAGLYLPGYDLAVLWVLLRNIPGARDRLYQAACADRAAAEAAFLVNRAMILAREIRIHRDLPAALVWRDDRLKALEQDWHEVRPLLHAASRRL